MVEVKMNEDGKYVAVLSQEQLNTIALLLGHSSFEWVLDCAKANEVHNVCVGAELTNLYLKFWSKVK